MNQLHKALKRKHEEIRANVQNRKAAKEVAEATEDFSINKKGKTQSFSLSMSKDVNFTEVQGGYEARVLLLEDGYIFNRVVFDKGSTKKAVQAFKEPLLLNDSHLGIEYSLVLGSIGAVTNIEYEVFGKKGDKYRAWATIFVDEANPAGKWLVDLSREMKRLTGDNILSVSAEVNFKDVELQDFAGRFEYIVSDYEFTGMAFCANPANVSSFETVELSNFLKEIKMRKDKEKEQVQLNEEQEDAKKTSEEVEEEVVNEEEENIDEKQDQDKEGEKEGDVEEEEKESVEKKEEDEEDEEEPEGEGEIEDEEEDEGAEEEEEEPKEEGELKEAVMNLSSQVQTLTDDLEVLKSTNKQLEKKLSAYQNALDKVGGDVFSREPDKGEKQDELTTAQKISKYGK